MRAAGEGIVAGVEARLPGWVVAQVGRILDAWGRADAATRARAEAGARDAGGAAAGRVAGRLRELQALDPSEQSTTPLEVVRSAYREPTAVLDAAGVPSVERDDFDERAWPDDRYGLVPRTFADLPNEDGDDDLGPLHLAWGLSKAAALHARVAESREAQVLFSDGRSTLNRDQTGCDDRSVGGGGDVAGDHTRRE